MEQVGRNALTRLHWLMHQHGFFPHSIRRKAFPLSRDRLHVIHEGIDTHIAKPNPDVNFEVRGVRIDRSVPTITFVNRNLECLRGFDLFMFRLDPATASDGADLDCW